MLIRALAHWALPDNSKFDKKGKSVMLNFTRHEAFILKDLNSYKDKDLSINKRILKAKLSWKLQKIHVKHAKARLKRAKTIAPLLLGQKIMSALGIKSFDDLENHYLVVPKASALGRKIQMSGHNNDNGLSLK